MQFVVDGPGKINSEGTYHAPASHEHQCALVTCKVGNVTGSARIRIVPPLPWKFDFNHDQNVPLTWLGGRIRWEIRGKDGEKYIVKKTLLPTPKDPNNKLGTRSYLWMGPTQLSNYSIQADVLLKELKVESGEGNRSGSRGQRRGPEGERDCSRLFPSRSRIGQASHLA